MVRYDNVGGWVESGHSMSYFGLDGWILRQRKNLISEVLVGRYNCVSSPTTMMRYHYLDS